MNEIREEPSPVRYDDEVDLGVIFRRLWGGKWLIVGTTLFATVIAVVISMMIPNVYRAEALLASNERERAGGLSALASQYGGLAGLAGINLDVGDPDKVVLGLEVLKSRKFISDFIERHDLLVPLIASRGWDEESGDLIIETNDYDLTAGEWVRDVRPPKKTIPSLQEAYEEFMEILSVSTNKKTGIVTVAVEHHSPILAKQWVDWLVDDLNANIMRQDVLDSELAIAYLNDQIANTSVAELRGLFYQLIEEQTKTLMLAEVTREYLLRTLDPAIVPEVKAKPNRPLLVILFTLLSFLISMMAVLISGYSRDRGAD